MKRLRPTRFPRRNPTRRALLKIYRALRRHYGPQNWWPAETPFEVMIGAILTQNTAWTNVEKAIRNLKRKNLLFPQSIRRMRHSSLAREIRPAGYFNVKANRLKNFINFLWRRYQGDPAQLRRTPLVQLRPELLAVKGVGKETADSILLYAVGKPIFVVDAYTRRIFSRHRYVRGTEEYDQIQSVFTKSLPKSVPLYNDFHAQLVAVGKDFCRKAPRCEICPLRNFL